MLASITLLEHATTKLGPQSNLTQNQHGLQKYRVNKIKGQQENLPFTHMLHLIVFLVEFSSIKFVL
jgi:hypothetical protein